MLRYAVIILSASFLLYSAVALEEDVDTVQYNENNFSEEVAKKNHFVMFYAPWCWHSKKLLPTWRNLTKMMNNDENSRIRIAQVDCTTDNSVCDANDVLGYPTLTIFKTGDTTGVKFTGETRDLPSLTSFINEQLGNTPTEEPEQPVTNLVQSTNETLNN